MMAFFIRYFILLGIGLLYFSTLAKGKEVRWVVGVKEAAPFVIIDKDMSKVSGFSIDLIKEIAMVMDEPVKIDFSISSSLEVHLDRVINNEVDFGIAATSITDDRASKIDFSFPFFKSRLGILTKRYRENSVWSLVLSSKVLYVFLGLFIYILICGNLIWLLERGESSFNDRWVKGFFEGVWWTIVTMSTVGYGDFVPRKVLSRVMASITIFSGIIIFSISIGVFSSLMTISHLEGGFKDISDLSGRKVSCILGTTSFKVMKEKGAVVIGVKNLKEAVLNLSTDKVVAVVYDIHLLQYYINQLNASNFELVDVKFRDEYYGIEFPFASKIRKQVNIGLLNIMKGKDSRYNRIYNKWFGKSRI